MAFSIKTLLLTALCLCGLAVGAQGQAQHSVARQWNELLIGAIKKDFARPTVHARNLFHASIAMYDAWAAYEPHASPYFLGQSFRHYYCPFTGVPVPENVAAAQEEAISYAMFRLLVHRFATSPNAAETLANLEKAFASMGYEATYTSTAYNTGPPAALGNYIAAQLITYGMGDGANEAEGYQNLYYQPYNPPLAPFEAGNPGIEDFNRWQPLALSTFIDQGGNPLNEAPPFLSAEWGKVVPFALQEEDLTIYSRNGNQYWVYHDPGTPPLMNSTTGGGTSADYAWNFALVAIWASHLDPDDGTMMDISPAATGNISSFPTTVEEMKSFYRLSEGGDAGTGYAVNPKTGAPYQPQLVPRGDYTRVLAEFWADGPNSETPPGHWFSILNYVNDHPALEKRMGGQGEVLDNLEWDVKAYLALGGAVHDAAIAAWGIKGYYDYVRPVSAIRAMAEKGQSSDPQLPHYHPAGLPLLEGYIELVGPEDPLVRSAQDIGKVKLYTWRGPAYIDNPASDKAGAGWILAEEWWPYQRPTFVTPPFAGYISGHSTFSRSAAEVLSLLTGDEYFPGGMSEFPVQANKFLVFENGPSVDMRLQWAKYKDASDQCSLSRIWGGIHPPADDIPGRRIGQRIGVAAFQHATKYFRGEVAAAPVPVQQVQLKVYPNPAVAGSTVQVRPDYFVHEGKLQVVNSLGQLVYARTLQNNADAVLEIPLGPLPKGLYIITIETKDKVMSGKMMLNP